MHQLRDGECVDADVEGCVIAEMRDEAIERLASRERVIDSYTGHLRGPQVEDEQKPPKYEIE